jgi:hypothetical protein
MLGSTWLSSREQAGHEPESATQILAGRIREPLNHASEALVARVSGRAADDPITLIRTANRRACYLNNGAGNVTRGAHQQKARRQIANVNNCAVVPTIN